MLTRQKKKEREDKELAEQMIDTYLAWQSQNENEVIDVEMKFAFDLSGVSSKGSLTGLSEPLREITS
jgi:hypothetical protein